MKLISLLIFAILGFFAFKLTGPSTYPYLLFEATNTSETIDGKFPLIVFLHGSGERGTDLSKVEVHGPPMIVKEDKEFPFYVLSPQCPEKTWWKGKKVNKLVNEILDKHPIDRNRVYITGLSMGGFGSWAAAIANPDLYAALAPICGAEATKAKHMEKISHIPMWVFHGAKDKIVPISGSEALVAKAKAVGADVRYTVYENADHDSWTVTYNNPELYHWFLKCSKK